MKKLLSIALAIASLASGVAAPVRAATHTVTLSWIAPAAGTLTLTGYNVYRLAGACPAQPSLSAFTKLTTTPLAATVLTFQDTGLADAVTNCYSVTAVYGTVESGAGFFVQATTTLVVAVTVATPPSQGAPVVTSN